MPLRVPRLIKAAAVAGLAAAPVIAVGLLTLASPVRASPVPATTVPITTVPITTVPANTVPTDEYWLSTSHIAQAWRTDQGAGVTVAVLADGVAAGQPDISGSVIVGPDFTGSGRRPGGPHYGVVGTGLASLIVGHGHGKHQGVFGVAPAARVLSVRVTLSPGDPLWARGQITSRLPAAIAAGIRYAVNHGASVIDLPADPGMVSVAGKAPGSGKANATAAGPDPAERAAVAYAVRKGVVLVAPAGDDAQSGDAAAYPAAYPGVIAVGSADKNLTPAPYSSRQPYVALAAAGQQVIAASPTGYQTMNGTWAASAIVAGVAALVRSEFPVLTATQVRSAIIDGAARMTGTSSTGAWHRIIDAEGAIATAMTMSPPGADLAAKGALPRVSPVTPPVPSLGSSIRADLIKDGIISLAALGVMLVPIMWYGSVTRRRDRLALAAAQERRDRPHPEHATMLADPLLQYFAPQHAKPADRTPQPRSAPSPRFQPTSSLAGRTPLAQSERAARLGLSSPSPPDAWSTTQAGGRLAASELAGSGQTRGGQAGNGQATSGSAFSLPKEPADGPGPVRARLGPEPTVRHASVTGSPPWGPAPEPTTALPWTPHPTVPPTPAPSGTASSGTAPSGTGPSGTGPSGTTPPGTARNDPPARVSMPPRSLFDPSPVVPPSELTGGPHDASDPLGSPASAQDSGSRPIYVWNPASSADTLGGSHDDKTDWLSIGRDSDLLPLPYFLGELPAGSPGD